MPAMGKLQGVAMVQTAMAEPPRVEMASSMAPESRKQTPEQTPNIYTKWWELNSEKETYLWRTHSIICTGLKRHQRWEVAAVAQRHGQEHLQSLLVSGVTAETHHADPTL